MSQLLGGAEVEKKGGRDEKMDVGIDKEDGLTFFLLPFLYLKHLDTFLTDLYLKKTCIK